MKKTIVKAGCAEICGYEGAFCRERDENGKELATGIWDCWYAADGKDDNGNDYTIIWALKDEYDLNNMPEDEGEFCDWDNPYMVLDTDGHNITSNIILY